MKKKYGLCYYVLRYINEFSDHIPIINLIHIVIFSFDAYDLYVHLIYILYVILDQVFVFFALAPRNLNVDHYL